MISNQRAYRLQLGVFAKYWEPGKVKTRLAASVGDEKAARIYYHLLIGTLDQFSHVADRPVLCYSPKEKRDEFEKLLTKLLESDDKLEKSQEFLGLQPDACQQTKKPWQLEPQSEGDLGERIKAYFDQAFANQELEQPTRVALIGSDSPTLPPQYINDAFTMLDEVDVVLGPTEDGGYYLVAAKEQTPPIFANIDWSTPQVLQQTIQQLESKKLSYELLPEWFDIDDEGDLNRMWGFQKDHKNDWDFL